MLPSVPILTEVTVETSGSGSGQESRLLQSTLAYNLASDSITGTCYICWFCFAMRLILYIRYYGLPLQNFARSWWMLVHLQLLSPTCCYSILWWITTHLRTDVFFKMFIFNFVRVLWYNQQSSVYIYDSNVFCVQVEYEKSAVQMKWKGFFDAPSTLLQSTRTQQNWYVDALYVYIFLINLRLLVNCWKFGARLSNIWVIPLLLLVLCIFHQKHW